jgi:hypothetical protein
MIYFIAITFLGCSCSCAMAALRSSAYLSMNTDRTVCSTTTLLSQTVTLASSDTLLVESDGRYFPVGLSAADIRIVVDSQTISDDAFMDWRQSVNPQQHSFNVVGAVSINPGPHTVQLLADYISGCYTVGADSNLSIMVHPAASVAVKALTADTRTFQFTTFGITPGIPTPFNVLVSNVLSLSSKEDIVALASGRSYRDASDGDSMWGIYFDWVNGGNTTSLWTVNDICTCAETQAPMFTHAFYPSVTGKHTISLGASEFPWQPFQPFQGENPASYRVGAGTRLVTLTGGMTVRGSAPTAKSDSFNNWYDWNEIGSNSDANFPLGTDVRFASATFSVPSGHNGIVMFVAKSRVQADGSDLGGTVRLWISVDGQNLSSTGVQQLKFPNSQSQRTISASYLAAGARALKPGKHTVEVYTRADGSFLHVVLVHDLPLIWFD